MSNCVKIWFAIHETGYIYIPVYVKSEIIYWQQIEDSGYYGDYQDVLFEFDFSPGYGWDGITVAILAGNNPLIVLLSAGFFGMLRSGAVSMNFAKTLSVDLISVLQGIIICFVAAPLLWKAINSLIKKRRSK